MSARGNLREVAPVAALAFANKVRAEHGLPALTALLPGEQYSNCRCPIAETIAYGMVGTAPCVVQRDTAIVTVDYDGDAHYYEPASEHDAPADVADFIELFDRGEYPSLVAA